jgi:hypothetical protein
MASIARGWKWTFFCLKLWRVSVFTNGIVKCSFLFDCLSIDWMKINSPWFIVSSISDTHG